MIAENSHLKAHKIILGPSKPNDMGRVKGWYVNPKAIYFIPIPLWVPIKNFELLCPRINKPELTKYVELLHIISVFFTIGSLNTCIY